MERAACAVSECGRQVASKGRTSSGRVRYSRYCRRHVKPAARHTPLDIRVGGEYDLYLGEKVRTVTVAHVDYSDEELPLILISWEVEYLFVETALVTAEYFGYLFEGAIQHGRR